MDTPEIAMNYESKRLTPTFVGFRAAPEFDINKAESIGIEDGKLLKPNFGNSALEIMSLRPWLGTGFLPVFLDLEKGEAEKTAEKLSVNTSAARLSLTELSTVFFKLYIDCVSSGKPVNSVTVVVPSIFTVPQRREIETAVRGAGFKFLAAIDDVEAISNSYSLEKTNKFSAQPRTVLFIDVGAASIKAYCISFEIKKDDTGKYGNAYSTRLSYVYAKGQGGAYLTSGLVALIKTKFGIKSATASENIRLFMAAEKLKIQLTLLKSATTVVDNINGEDREITVTREELDSISSPLIDTVVEVAKNASEGIEFNDIEVIGGCSRVPIVLSSIQAAFSTEFIGHSLNADEALVMGAGYYAQFRAGISRFQSVKLSAPKSLFTISSKIENETIPICVFNETCNDNMTINTTIKQFEMTYENIDPSLKTHSFGYKVEMKPNSTLLVRFVHNPTDAASGKVCVNGSFCQYAPLLPLVPIFAASPSFHAIMNADAQRKRLGRIRNDLEHFTLRVIDEVEHNESVKAFTNDMQRFKINSIAEKTRKWIWEEADTVTDEKNFSTRFNEIRDAIMPVYIRIAENRTMMFNVKLMMQTIQLSKLQTMLEWPINKSYINKTEIENFTRLLNETEEWFLKALNETKDTPLWEDKKIKSKDFEVRTRKLAQEMYRISMIPPPPKKSIMKSITNKTSGWMNKFYNTGFMKKVRGLFKNRPIPSPTAKKGPPPKRTAASSPKKSPTPVAKPAQTKAATPTNSETPQKPAQEDTKQQEEVSKQQTNNEEPHQKAVPKQENEKPSDNANKGTDL